MSIHQIHFDRKFYQDKKTGYWMSTDCGKDNTRVRAHQWVWMKNNFNVPKGYHIHHINEDKSDNRIENLELIKASRHLGHHMMKRMLNPENRRKNKELCDKIRPLTKKWHASEEGIAWHKYHALKQNFGNGPLIKYNCQQCSNEYESKLKAKNRTRFCSNICKSQFRRDSGVDNVERTCVFCLKTYSINKYSKSKTCSISCGRKNLKS